jgi:hypothetical protein
MRLNIKPFSARRLPRWAWMFDVGRGGRGQQELPAGSEPTAGRMLAPQGTIHRIQHGPTRFSR